MKYYILLGLVVTVGVVATWWMLDIRTATAPGQMCTADAMICPDGSGVGRTGPNCEFAPCPTVTTSSDSTSVDVRLNQAVTALGVRLTVTSVLEDSRCPTDVQCIQAGTVRVKALLVSGLGTSTPEFKLGTPITTETETLTLTQVTPTKLAGTPIKNSEYLFTFSISKRASVTPGIAPYTSGIQGSVSLGPTCPVQRDPPDPACADKPYVTTVTVMRSGSSAVFASLQSDTSGAFQFSLPPGSYTVSALGGTMLPRCAAVSVTVPTSGYVRADISCDTGIR